MSRRGGPCGNSATYLCLRWLCVGLAAICVGGAAYHDSALRVADSSIFASIGPRGVRFEPNAGDWFARLSVPAVDCGGRPLAPGNTVPHAVQPDRVMSVRRANARAVDAWYAPGRRGVEQGFTIHAACRSRLAVHVHVEGLTARPRAAGGAELVDDSGTARLSYTDLHARDARGQALPVGMTVADSSIVLDVDAKHAVFPVVIDPLVATPEQHLVAPDGVDRAGFGASIALDTDTALIGAPGFPADVPGAAYIFVRSGSGWSLQQKLTASDEQPDDAFGTAVSVSGNTAIVGANQANVGGAAYEGAAYVFVRSGNTWTEQQKLVPDQTIDDFGFGSAVQVSGDTAIVGAPGGALGPVATYVFVRSGSTWTQSQKLLPILSIPAVHFGQALALSGDSVVIAGMGAHGSAGAAEIYVRSGAAWSEQQQLVPSDPLANFYGSAVALSGDTALAGAGAASVGGADYAGVAYVFVRAGNAWSEQQELFASNADVGDEFGTSVAVAGNVALVGADNRSVAGKLYQGAAYLFRRVGVAWSGQQLLVASDGSSGDQFGNAVALDGSTAFVGASRDQIGANEYQGSAYVYSLAEGGPCSADGDCPAGQFCAPDHECSPERGPGEACKATECAQAGCRLCASGYCVDGFCCNTACPADCERCDITRSQGMCTAVPDSGVCVSGGGSGGTGDAGGSAGAAASGGRDAGTTDAGRGAGTAESSGSCSCRAAGKRRGEDALALFVLLAVAGTAFGRRSRNRRASR